MIEESDQEDDLEDLQSKFETLSCSQETYNPSKSKHPYHLEHSKELQVLAL